MTQSLSVRTVDDLISITDLPPDRSPALVYLASLSETGRCTMLSALGTVADRLTHHQVQDARLIDWRKLRYSHVQALRSLFAKDYAPATTNKLLSAIKSVMKQSWLLGYITADEYGHIKEVKGIKGSTLPAGRALTGAEITAMLVACHSDNSPAGARDGALLVLLRVGGLRRSEIAGLALDDYDRINQTLKIRGKGNKEREVPVNPTASEALSDWLAVRGDRKGYLFCPVNKSGKVNNRVGIRPQSIYNAVNRRARESGVKELSPHDFRRTFVSDLLDAGVDISVVQKLAGHAKVETTQRYDRRDVSVQREAVNRLKTGYTSRSSHPET